MMAYKVLRYETSMIYVSTSPRKHIFFKISRYGIISSSGAFTMRKFF